MVPWKRHIALLAAWIFLFPVLYQPVHIIQHHSHERSEHACEHHHHHHPTKAAADLTRINHAENHCLICEYEFVSKDLPGAYKLFHAPVRYYEVKTAPDLSYDKPQRFTQINPRAPPKS